MSYEPRDVKEIVKVLGVNGQCVVYLKDGRRFEEDMSAEELRIRLDLEWIGDSHKVQERR